MSDLHQTLRALRVLRGTGTPGDVARPLVERALAAAEREGLAVADLMEAPGGDPWATHDRLEERVLASGPGWRRAVARAPAASLGLVAALAGCWAAWVVWSRPAWDEGLEARYHPRQGLAGHPVVRRDTTLAHAWGAGAPLPELPPDRFSVVWTGCLVVDRPRWLFAGADDGLRIDVDGRRTFERWGPNPMALVPAGRLEPGVHRIRVEYEELGGYATVDVRWGTTPDGEPVPVPASALVPPGGSRAHECPG